MCYFPALQLEGGGGWRGRFSHVEVHRFPCRVECAHESYIAGRRLDDLEADYRLDLLVTWQASTMDAWPADWRSRGQLEHSRLTALDNNGYAEIIESQAKDNPEYVARTWTWVVVAFFFVENWEPSSQSSVRGGIRIRVFCGVGKSKYARFARCSCRVHLQMSCLVILRTFAGALAQRRASFAQMSVGDALSQIAQLTAHVAQLEARSLEHDAELSSRAQQRRLQSVRPCVGQRHLAQTHFSKVSLRHPGGRYPPVSRADSAEPIHTSASHAMRPR